MAAPTIRFSGITKRFPGVLALSDVTFDVRAGSCHAICGENGAGKSTLGKILAGIERPDLGTLYLDNEVLELSSPRDALAAGIAIVHQELAFCDNLSVGENLCLGRLPRRWGIVNRERMREMARELLAAVGASIDPRRTMASLRPAEQQLAQIAAAVGGGANVIVFDEPTSSLDQNEADRLFTLVGALRARGTTILYVSHRLAEVFRLCDDVTVLRDGRHVTTQPTASFDERELVRQMIGRPLDDYYPAHLGGTGRGELIRVDGLSSSGRFSDISFSIRGGEVLGLAGLVGAGRTEIANAIFGLDSSAHGSISVRGQRCVVRSPRDAMHLGIGYVPEDRKRLGLVLGMTAAANLTLPTLSSVARAGWVNRARERERAGDELARVGIPHRARDAVVSTLSGGNQQKVVLAKWLAGGSEILILDEPTRGIDVGAKAEIHAWIDRLALEGKAILLISSELPELLALSTRIIVLRGGHMVGEQTRADASQESLMRLMCGAASESGEAA